MDKLVERKSPAETIIDRIGGLTKTARLLSDGDRKFPVSTVQGWKVRGKIPQEYWVPLIEAARAISIEITLEMFLADQPESAE